jgi:hypothetical protein
MRVPPVVKMGRAYIDSSQRDLCLSERPLRVFVKETAFEGARIDGIPTQIVSFKINCHLYQLFKHCWTLDRERSTTSDVKRDEGAHDDCVKKKYGLLIWNSVVIVNTIEKDKNQTFFFVVSNYYIDCSFIKSHLFLKHVHLAFPSRVSSLR